MLVMRDPEAQRGAPESPYSRFTVGQ